MSIVFITIPGEAKREFAAALERASKGALKLVIVQKPGLKPLMKRFLTLFKRAGLNSIAELWYAVRLRYDGAARKALQYFREYTPGKLTSKRGTVPVLEVESVNGEDAYQALVKLSPDLLVVWGSTILEPRILKTAKRSINLHLGFCPFYRGALANQCAVLRDDVSKIGATVHYINGKPDAGDTLAIVSGDVRKPPRELFRDLNDRAMAAFLDVAVKLHAGLPLAATPQDLSVGENFLLKSWTPKTRYVVAKKVLAWEEKSHALSSSNRR